MLLDKFEFIKPEKYSGFEPCIKAIPIVKKNQFKYVDLGTIIGDAPKCMIALYEYEKGGRIKQANSNTWKKYIAKSASKWYPNESITEHLLNVLGNVFELKMAKSKLRRINKQIWFLSEFFIKEEHSLYHGADLYISHFDNDKDFVENIQNDNKTDDQEFFTIQLVQEALQRTFPNDAETIFADFIKMVIFDGIIGNNDRHAYNWGVLTSVRPNEPACFSPIYDTARGLFWNDSEINIQKFLQNTRVKGVNTQIKKYVVSSRPKIGWDGLRNLNHIELLEYIFNNEIGISKEKFVNFISDSNLSACINVIDIEFANLFSPERKEIIKECLTLRFNTIRNFIDK